MSVLSASFLIGPLECQCVISKLNQIKSNLKFTYLKDLKKKTRQTYWGFNICKLSDGISSGILVTSNLGFEIEVDIFRMILFICFVFQVF